MENYSANISASHSDGKEYIPLQEGVEIRATYNPQHPNGYICLTENKWYLICFSKSESYIGVKDDNGVFISLNPLLIWSEYFDLLNPRYHSPQQEKRTWSDEDMWKCWEAAKHFFRSNTQPLNFTEWLAQYSQNPTNS